MTETRDPHPADATLDFLRSVFPPEWREPALGQGAVSDWERDNAVILPEPYRTFIAEISNGSAVGPADDGGLQPLGWLPDTWLGVGPRQPGKPFPLEAAWPWEDDESTGLGDPRITAAFNHGSVVLGSEEGPAFWLLVTTGPHRGEVWMITDAGAAPMPGDQAWGFEEWVRHWHTGHGWWD
ncbi:SMI1/KNR4 family protein [Streptomyces sp. SID9727]|uniref:SMI1/KNR4 family protein n=1 Tax=Streptomyces sp. SID9727 TaxID=2706114 RepID=UPI0013C5C7C0|nr:SMI1/KNR4 family protein [Streptomyces sp. SID9727]NEC65973.1 SMI1/KNR4 family protein [Streptomyces sp. SID9727]